MGTVETVYEEYTRMRDSGMAVKAALNLLRDHIHALNETDKQTIARQLRDHEAQRTQAAPVVQAAPAAPVIEAVQAAHDAAAPAPDAAPAPAPDPRPSGLRRLTMEHSPAASPRQVAAIGGLEWITCPHCGKSSQRHEVLCYACGQLLRATNTENETQALADTNDLSFSNDFFGEDTELLLRARATGRVYEARPPRSDHEIVIGRSTPGSAVIPDIDLCDQSGDKLGVSRLHLTLRYDTRYHTVSVFDLGSANGTYLNGQRLHAHEVRVLRDGDELRLGRLVLAVAFRHPA